MSTNSVLGFQSPGQFQPQVLEHPLPELWGTSLASDLVAGANFWMSDTQGKPSQWIRSQGDAIHVHKLFVKPPSPPRRDRRAKLYFWMNIWYKIIIKVLKNLSWKKNFFSPTRCHFRLSWQHWLNNLSWRDEVGGAAFLNTILSPVPHLRDSTLISFSWLSHFSLK